MRFFIEMCAWTWTKVFCMTNMQANHRQKESQKISNFLILNYMINRIDLGRQKIYICQSFIFIFVLQIPPIPLQHELFHGNILMLLYDLSFAVDLSNCQGWPSPPPPQPTLNIEPKNCRDDLKLKIMNESWHISNKKVLLDVITYICKTNVKIMNCHIYIHLTFSDWSYCSAKRTWSFICRQIDS